MELVIAIVLTGVLFAVIFWLDAVGSKMPVTKDPCGNNNIKRKPWDYM